MTTPHLLELWAAAGGFALCVLALVCFNTRKGSR